MTRTATKAGMTGLALAMAAALTAADTASDRWAEAERLAAAALATPEADASLADARRALALTQDFDPTGSGKPAASDTRAGDAYREALAAYRSHRARVYEAVGTCLLAQGQPHVAVRYLRRALLLEASERRLVALARALLKENRAPEALSLLTEHIAHPHLLRMRQATRDVPIDSPAGSDVIALAQQAADAVGIPSLQAEIDRLRIHGPTSWLGPVHAPQPRDGPVHFGSRLRLSTGEPFRLDADERVAILYAADGPCRSCRDDIETAQMLLDKLARSPGKRGMGPLKGRVVAAPAPDQEGVLWQFKEKYHNAVPVVLGAPPGVFGDSVPVAWVVGRRGWSAFVLTPPLHLALESLLTEVFARHDVDEPLPRPTWNHRPVVPKGLRAQPGLTHEDVIPGEDDEAPPEVEQALIALRTKKPLEARRLFDEIAQRGDGFLLLPEARLNAAVCLSLAGDVTRARELLRTIGDSRVQDHVHEVMDSLPAGPKR